MDKYKAISTVCIAYIYVFSSCLQFSQRQIFPTLSATSGIYYRVSKIQHIYSSIWFFWVFCFDLFSSDFIETQLMYSTVQFKLYSIWLDLQTSWNNDHYNFSEHPSSLIRYKIKETENKLFLCDQNS